MLENEIEQPPQRHPLTVLLLIIAVIFIGFVVVGPLIGFIISLPLFPGTMMEYTDALQHIPQHPEIKIPLYILQGCATLIGLIVAPALFLKTERRSVLTFFKGHPLAFTPIIITIVVVVVFMGVNSIFIQWNENIHFPEFLKDFGDWAKEKETDAAEITKFLTQFDSTFEVVIAMIVIAVLPAIGEELVFRGLIQNEFFKATKNIHLSIWISAMLFSAMHVQFFGFVPRMLLGALFGYLYYWSGNLSISILAHFVNNGFSVIGLYLYQRGHFNFDIEKAEAQPWPAVAFSGVLTVILLFAFKRYYQRKPEVQ